MKKKSKYNKISLALLAILYINILPYLCRLLKGIDWAKQYLPDEGHLIGGLIFFHCFYSIPAVILILSIYTSKNTQSLLFLLF